MSRRPIGIDLFAGAGGMSLGVEQAGFDVRAALEIDPIHCATHAYNFPDATIVCADAAEVTGNDLRRAAGALSEEVDLLFGGPPCQGFSFMGKRALDDPRNALVREFVRLVREIQPAAFIFENVPGLASGAHRAFLSELIEAFEQAGYRMPMPYRVLDSAFFGVPQRRRRLILLGTRRDLPATRYPEPTCVPADIVRKSAVLDLSRGPTVWEAIGDLPEVDDFPELSKRDWIEVSLGKPLSEYAMLLRGELDDPDDLSYRRLGAKKLTGLKRAEHTALSRQRFSQAAHGSTEPVSHFKKLDPQGLCNTLRAGTARNRGAFTSPRPIHPFTARCITVREAARLHSFPDWFSFHSTVWHGFRQIGNSVPPLLAREVAKQVRVDLGLASVHPARYVELGDCSALGVSMTKAARHFMVSPDVIPQRVRGIEVRPTSSPPSRIEEVG